MFGKPPQTLKVTCSALGDTVNWAIQKAASFEWGPEQETTLQQVRTAGQAALGLGLYSLIFEISVVRKGAGWSLRQTPIEESQCRCLDLASGGRLCSAVQGAFP